MIQVILFGRLMLKTMLSKKKIRDFNTIICLLLLKKKLVIKKAELLILLNRNNLIQKIIQRNQVFAKLLLKIFEVYLNIMI